MGYKRNMDNIREAQNPRQESEGPRKKKSKKTLTTLTSGMSPRHKYKLSGNATDFM